MGFFDQFIETTNRLSPVQTFQSARNFRMAQQQQEFEQGLAVRKQALDEQTAALQQQMTQFNLQQAQRKEQGAKEIINLAESIALKTIKLRQKPAGAIATEQVAKGKKVGTVGQVRQDIGQRLSTSIGLEADQARLQALVKPEAALPEDLTRTEQAELERIESQITLNNAQTIRALRPAQLKNKSVQIQLLDKMRELGDKERAGEATSADKEILEAIRNKFKSVSLFDLIQGLGQGGGTLGNEEINTRFGRE